MPVGIRIRERYFIPATEQMIWTFLSKFSRIVLDIFLNFLFYFPQYLKNTRIFSPNHNFFFWETLYVENLLASSECLCDCFCALTYLNEGRSLDNTFSKRDPRSSWSFWTQGALWLTQWCKKVNLKIEVSIPLPIPRRKEVYNEILSHLEKR